MRACTISLILRLLSSTCIMYWILINQEKKLIFLNGRSLLMVSVMIFDSNNISSNMFFRSNYVDLNLNENIRSKYLVYINECSLFCYVNCVQFAVICTVCLLLLP